MMRVLFILLACLGSAVSMAESRDFSEPVTVASVPKGRFIHLESSGRRSLAVSGNTVGVVWEDNRSGTPAVYAAFRTGEARKFGAPVRISAEGAAYEPVVVALPDSIFVIGWESSDRVWLRAVRPGRQGKLVQLETRPARQLSLAVTPGGGVLAVYAAKLGKDYAIVSRALGISRLDVKPGAGREVDPSADRGEQAYPAVTVTTAGTTVAWEDRRHGATRLFTAFAPPLGDYMPYQVLNDFTPPQKNGYGQGTGAMRVTLGSDGRSQVAAAWLDKRDFVHGYDVYAAVSSDGGRSFGPDEKAQDFTGDNTPQWHVALAVSTRGEIVVAWDDTRDGSPDVWHSSRVNNAWQDDLMLPGAGGPGQQVHPVLVFDSRGRLHAAWLDRQDGTTRLRYARADEARPNR